MILSILKSPISLSPAKQLDFSTLMFGAIIGFSAHSFLFSLFVFLEVKELFIFNIFSCLAFAFIFLANRYTDFNKLFFVSVGIIEIIIHAVFAVYILGWNSGFHYYIFLSIIGIFLVGHFGNTVTYVVMVFVILTYVFLSIYASSSYPVHFLTAKTTSIISVLNILIVTISVGILTGYYNYIAYRASKKLFKSNNELENKSKKVMSFNNELAQQTEELQIQSEQLEQANKSTTDSIKYALRIQQAILPSSKEIEKLVGKDNIMLLYIPKDIISGDFYWTAEKNGKVILVVADCTGHGVPGAMLTMIGESLLNNIVLEKEITEPSLILDQMQKYFSKLFRDEYGVRDGMDISISSIDYVTKELLFSSARNPLIYIQNDELQVIKGDKMSIGQVGNNKEQSEKFTSHKIDISIPTVFYMYSDGYQDQFGGKENKKFYTKNLRNLFFSIHKKPMAEQRKILKLTFLEWKDFIAQTDDIAIMGVRII